MIDTRSLLESYDSAIKRNRAVPAWVLSIYTKVPCTTTPENEVAMMVEFLDRFGDIFKNEESGPC